MDPPQDENSDGESEESLQKREWKQVSSTSKNNNLKLTLIKLQVFTRRLLNFFIQK